MDIVQMLLNAISPHLRKMIVDFALNLKVEALKTDRTIDDGAVFLLFLILGIPWE